MNASVVDQTFDEIFRYENGERDANGNPVVVGGDPVEIEYVFKTTLEGIDIDGEINKIRDPDGAREIPIRTLYHVYNTLSPGIQAAFKVKPLNPATMTGLTLQRQMNLLADFFNWVAGVKKNIDESASSSTSMAGHQQESTGMASQPTMDMSTMQNLTMGSGSTNIE